MIPDAVHVYEKADTRGLRTPEPWCVTVIDGRTSTTTRYRNRGDAEDAAAGIAGAKT